MEEINIRVCIEEYMRIEPEHNSELRKYLSKSIWTPSDRQSILDVLSTEVIVAHKTNSVASQFPTVLLELLHRIKQKVESYISDGSGSFSKDGYAFHQRFCCVIGVLLPFNTDVLNFARSYMLSHPPIFEKLMVSRLPDVSTPKKRKVSKRLNCCQPSTVEILSATLSIVRHLADHIIPEWDWSVIYDFLDSEDQSVKWFVCNIVAMVTKMTDAERNMYLCSNFEVDELKSLIVRHELCSIPRLIPRISDQESDSVDENDDVIKTHTLNSITPADLSPQVVCISGVLLSKYHNQTTPTEEHSELELVRVPSTNYHLRSLALAVSSGTPVLLEGPVGCGKTSLVEYLALITGRLPSMLTKVQIADQTDSKSLLGMYCCSDTPGEFVWRPGCITQAMINGAWILLEDVDLAPVDVLSTLIPILESKTMTLPGRSEIIKAAPGFHVFATQRILISSSGSYTNTASSLSIVDQLWTKIRVEPLSESELLRVISVKWPELQSVQDRILQVYLMVSKGQHAVTSNDSDKTDVMSDSLMSDNAGRLISTRDLMKWCRRICHEFDVSSLAMAELVFQDALDCFCSCISSKSAMKASATKLGASLNIVSTKVEFFCNKYKPNIMKFDDHVVIGRANLAMNIDRYSPALSGVNTRTFSFTRPATELLEKISVAVVRQEPVLLVGETGTGKTHCVQYLSELTGHKLFVINMNQQSDSSDLLGGYKPVDCKLIVAPVKEKFDDIFYRTFSRHQNSKFLGHITKMFLNHRWCDLVKLMTHPIQAAIKRLCQSKLSSEKELHLDWIEFEQRLPQLVKQLKHAETSLAFSFIEGTLVKALKAGNWVLLDEINLAEADTLQCLSGILESSIGSVSLIERGDDRPINRHKDFRLFACMNPATDVGKKDLPTGIRNRFTEFFVAELTEKSDLITLVESYLKGLSPTSSQVSGIVRFYLHVKKAAVEYLVDGTGHSPHYSLRTLCRALSYAAGNPCGNVARSLYEAFCVSFLTQLDRSSHPLMESLIRKFILKGVESKVIIKKSLPEPPGGHHVQFERYWILCGDKTPHVPDDYILTPSVRLNLGDLSRVVSARRFPVLLQGETSVGKTSLIQWLAQSSGNYCVRVNNHEHTDIQEYVGSYTADDSGKLVFQEGVLVRAMRNGYWIILDELNLAPTEVLEALNRVLDDNKELFIAETQTVVKAHPKFMLFATQNPPGQYGGRKVLSRAFRNRFVELHFDTIPTPELETILSQRCEIPLSYCKKMVAIMNELQVRRRSSGVFAGKQGYITLRDLFRWAERYRQASQQIQKFYDWDQHLAEEGYMLLAGRVRRQEECDVILEVIEKHMKRKIDESRLFSLSSDSSIVDALTKKLLDYSSSHLSFKHIVWVRNLQRLAVLVGQALRFGEPVLIVGETGCGKTTLCQLFADLKNQKLHSVNCHMHCESSDFLGGLRPVRDHDNSDDQSLFEWVDGPLVNAMRCGDVFLADEISLADDSVLERLNSVLESERTLRLTEKSFDPLNDDNSDLVIADKNFRFVATMNPGGDYGKKELSPALRDRFTEIWCPSTFTAEDLISIVEHNVNKEIRLSTQSDEITSGFGRAMVEFIAWFSNNTKSTRRIISVRDILSWTSFVNTICDNGQNNADRVDPAIAYFHGACLVFVDSVNSGASGNFRSDCIKFLVEQINRINGFDISQSINPCNADVIRSENYFGIQPFFIPTGSEPRIDLSRIFTFQAPTTNSNLTKVMRALQVQKAILLEGSPGVGKTTLISALAAVAGHKLVRINLSEQTDISDLFGSDLPVDGGKGGQFSWADGPFLQALKSGHWIILDELNLASQSVLEGLNACLDHRGEVFIPELGKSFCLQSRTTRLFASQNPMNQGGSRKGLPQSFLNRFSQVYIDPLSSADLVFIMEAMFPDIPAELVHKMVGFNNQLTENLVGGDSIRKKWEFNLRDLSRWCEIMKRKQNEDAYNPGNFVQLIYGDRMQTRGDKSTVHDLYERVFGEDYPLRKSNRNFVVTRNVLQVGQSFLSRSNVSGRSYSSSWRSSLCVLNRQLDSFESLMLCLEMGWMAILVGNEGTGKSSMIHALSQLTGHQLDVITVNSSMDTGDLLGGFEQVSIYHRIIFTCATVVPLKNHNSIVAVFCE
ncbi:MDN1 (predicted) [Pycnogonum litorale]